MCFYKVYIVWKLHLGTQKLKKQSWEKTRGKQKNIWNKTWKIVPGLPGEMKNGKMGKLLEIWSFWRGKEEK